MRLLYQPLILAIAAGATAGPATPPEPAGAPGSGQVVEYLTAKSTSDRLARQAPLTFRPLAQPEEHLPTIMIDPTKRFQTVVGFGGALTDAAAETYDKLPAQRQHELLRDYFDPEQGLGYTLFRTHINSCDFSSESYSYVKPGDADLTSFDIEHDRKHRIPFIKAALAAAPKDAKVFISPWSPPAWMKTNDTMLHGGRLRPEYRDAWAHYFVRFIQSYEAEGIPIWGLTVQNEPMAAQTWESCLYSADEERDFVRDHLGPALQQAGLSAVKVLIWDHNRGLMYQRAQTVLEDPAAARFVWGTAFHWYTGDHYDNVRLVHEAFPDKHLLFSEGCTYPFSWEHIDDWDWGERYGKAVLTDLNNWTEGWTDWNVLLDERGGPNHVGNYCYAPIHADTRSGKLHRTISYYYLGHFAKFIHPGAQRIACTSNDDRLLGTSFRNTDGSIATVVLNLTDENIPFTLWSGGQGADTASPAHSILTLIDETKGN
jgi:glucosylceramidase